VYIPPAFHRVIPPIRRLTAGPLFDRHGCFTRPLQGYSFPPPLTPWERRYGGGRRGDSEAAGEAFQRFHAAKPLFVCALDTGLSRSDLINLDWQQVDLENRLIRAARTKTGVQVSIPMTKRLHAELQAIGPHPAGTLVFRTVAGGRWAEAIIKRYFKTAKALAGIARHFQFHDMRHDFASALAQEGVSLFVIAQLLGHTSTAMTMRYAHLHPANLRAAIDALPGREVTRELPVDAAGSRCIPNPNVDNNVDKTT